MALFIIEITQKKGYLGVLKAALLTAETIENNLSSQQQNVQIHCGIIIQENKNVAMKKNEPLLHITIWVYHTPTPYIKFTEKSHALKSIYLYNISFLLLWNH